MTDRISEATTAVAVDAEELAPSDNGAMHNRVTVTVTKEQVGLVSRLLMAHQQTQKDLDLALQAMVMGKDELKDIQGSLSLASLTETSVTFAIGDPIGG